MTEDTSKDEKYGRDEGSCVKGFRTKKAVMAPVPSRIYFQRDVRKGVVQGTQTGKYEQERQLGTG